MALACRVSDNGNRSCVQTSLRSACTCDLGQDSPTQTDLARSIRAKYYNISHFACLMSYLGSSFTDNFHLSVKIFGQAKDSSYHLIATTPYNRTRVLRCQKV